MKKGVVQFVINTQDLYTKACRYIDKGELLRAVELLNDCLERKPEEVKYALELAGLYTEMGMYTKSNAVIVKHLMRENAPAEAMYYRAINAVGMNDIDEGKALLERYLEQSGKDSEFTEMAVQVLENIENSEYYVDGNVIGMPEWMAMQITELLNSERIDEAVDFIAESGVDQRQKVISLIGICFLCGQNRRNEKAKNIAIKTLKLFPRNLMAQCHFLVSGPYSGEEESKLFKQVKGNVVNYKTDDCDDLYRILVTFCHLREHSNVVKVAEKIKRLRPYDVAVRHMLACGYYYTGCKEKAAEQWRKADTIAGGSVIARYYIGICERDENVEPSYVYQPAYKEFMRMMHRINECAEGNTVPDSYDCLFLKWILENPATMEKTVFALALMAVQMQNDAVTKVLKELLIQGNASSEMKMLIAGLLGVTEGGEEIRYFSQGGVIVSYGQTPHPPEIYYKALYLALMNMRGRYREYQPVLLRIFGVAIAEAEQNGWRLRSAGALAAAFEAIFVMSNGQERISASKLCKIYSTTAESVNRQIERLTLFVEEKGKNYETD